MSKAMTFVRALLMCFTYPKELADAVNRALTPEDMDDAIADRAGAKL